MANDGQVDVIISQQAIDNINVANKALQESYALIIKVNEESRKGQSTPTGGGGGGGGGASATKSAREHAAAVDALNKKTAESLTLQNSVIKVSKDVATTQKSINELYVKGSSEKVRLNRQLKEETAQIKAQGSFYTKLNHDLMKSIKAYKELASQKAVNGKLNAQEEKQLVTLKNKMEKLNTQYQQVNGSLGNAGKGAKASKREFDSLGFSVAQITRESPAFINSMNTGFMAISNNIPILVDEIGRLGDKNKDLAKDGLQTKNVFAEVGKAFFSWQSLISIGIVLLTLFGGKIVNFISELLRGKDALSQFKKGIEDMTEAEHEAIGVLTTLIGVVNSSTASENERYYALQRLSEEYPKLDEHIKNQKDGLIDLNLVLDEYIKQIIKKAQVDALQIEVGELVAEGQKAQIKSKEKVADLTKDEIKQVLEFMELNKKVQKINDANALLGTKISKEQNNVLSEQTKMRKKLTGDQIAYSHALRDEEEAKDNLTKKTKELLDLSKKESKYVEGSVTALRKLISANNDYIETQLTIKDLDKAKILENENIGYQKQIDLILNKQKAEKKAKTKKIDTSSQDLDISELVLRQEIQKRIIENEKAGQAERITAQEEFSRLSLDIINKELEKAVLLAENNLNELLKVGNEATTKQLAALVKAEESKRKLKDGMLKDSLASIASDNKLETDKSIIEITARYGEIKNISLQQQNNMNAEIAKVRLDGANKTLQEQAKEIARFMNAAGIEGDLRVELEKQIQSLLAGVKNQPTNEKARDKMQEHRDREVKLRFAQDTANALFDIGNSIFDAKIQRIDAEIQAEEDRYDRLNQLAEGDAEQQRLIAIDRERTLEVLEQKRRKEEKKKAIFNKANALIGIAINTAVAISLAASQVGVGFVISTPLLIALGALQAAAVLAQPIPQFAEGGVMPHDGVALLGDGGQREVIMSPKGQLSITPDTDTFMNLEKGSKIYSSIDKFNAEGTSNDGALFNSKLLLNSIMLNQFTVKEMLGSKLELDEKLLEAMLLNTKAVKNSKSNTFVKTQKIDIPHEIWKSKYIS